jgi:hypothetical protein
MDGGPQRRACQIGCTTDLTGCLAVSPQSPRVGFFILADRLPSRTGLAQAALSKCTNENFAL